MKESILINGPVPKAMISSLLEALGNDTGAGGHSLFLGQVRADVTDGRRVKAIEYSAYEAMVMEEADKIKKSIIAEYDDLKSIIILHSVGIVNAGEISLFVLISAGHRHQAMQACSKTVELIKEKLPVWKKEIFENNTSEWRQNYQA
ncbi:MAG: molybdenum cofactor biosynthesis protein MoaE [Bacteroidales bacterium]|jgi:molybdopterin synthase catalytic subunit|nr:molybdenum cofactor biosynthesis protein MoaE [Bacteroidales bacterium]